MRQITAFISDDGKLLTQIQREVIVYECELKRRQQLTEYLTSLEVSDIPLGKGNLVEALMSSDNANNFLTGLYNIIKSTEPPAETDIRAKSLEKEF